MAEQHMKFDISCMHCKRAIEDALGSLKVDGVTVMWMRRPWTGLR